MPEIGLVRRLIIGDNLAALAAQPAGCAALIYADPPFNTGVRHTGRAASFDDRWGGRLASDAERAVLDGEARVAALLAIADHLGRGMRGYLTFMAARLVACARVLAPTGSLWLHCDPTASHSLKVLLDIVLGCETFRREVVWSYRRWPTRQRNFQPMHDTLLYYARPGAPFSRVLEPPTAEMAAVRRRGYNVGTHCGDGQRRVSIYDRAAPGVQARLPRWRAEGRAIYDLDEAACGNAASSVWAMPILAGGARERVGWPTQKPLALLERIVESTSRPGDLVLDPFCGSGTALLAAERLGRGWIGMDSDDRAAAVVEERVRAQAPLFSRSITVERRVGVG